MIVKLDFDRTYRVDREDGDWNRGVFKTVLRNGREKRIAIEISTIPQPRMESVYNLAFGPLDRKRRIKDKESITHADYSMVFSTILNFARWYLERRPYHLIGLDGSTNGRAYLYFRMIRQNFDFLSERFKIYGIKYYVRVKRRGTDLYENPFNFQDVQFLYHKFKRDDFKESSELENMFNYFIFEKKQNINYGTTKL